MKFTVYMKDPDTLHDAIVDAVAELKVPGLDDDEMRDVREHRVEKINKLCSRWFEYGEYVSIQIDTEAETATVLPAKS